MERKTLFYWIAQVIGWGAYFVLSMLLLFNTEDLVSTPNLYSFIAASIAFSIALSHTIRYIIVKQNLVASKLQNIIFWTLGMTLVAAYATEFFQHWMTAYAFKVDFVKGVPPYYERNLNWAEFSIAVFRSVLLYLLWTGFYLAFIFIEKSRKQEIQQLKLDASANEIELKNLRAQLNPHFMFNSLNSIRALVALDPEQAKSAITRLSSLLRHSINLGKQKQVKLEDEIELVKNYLELEKIRFEERLSIDYKIQENSMGCEIPPLMVQTIVENSIKHGISKSIEGGTICLDSKFENNQLDLTITNPGQLNSTLAENGVGVANTKKRLEIIYGDKGEFDIKQIGPNVVATIKINYS